jgi:hypothetical protein
MKVLFVAWQNQENRTWYPVGMLSIKDNKYVFQYTKGALEPEGFRGFGRMSDLKQIYESEELFPFFQNRLLSENRPEYSDMLDWLDIDNEENKKLYMLALGGGKRGTDQLEIFQCPEKDRYNKLTIKFFVHGISHLDKNVQKRINSLCKGERLFLMQDIQNDYDANAIALRTIDPVAIVGYCPRYLSSDIEELIKRGEAKTITVSVAKVNMEAPAQFRVLCCLSAPWPVNYRPCSGELYQPIVGSVDSCEV